MTEIAAQQFNHDVSAAKRAAMHGPVFITSRGEPTHVLLSLADYRETMGGGRTLREALVAGDDIDFTPAPLDLRLQVPDLS
ncbi:MAG: type II toxin-antitoxin system prevent-host-death family antitoxin [Bifidobacteriaceae bacterium]|jgi:prevent-host-death family protein|nr:type II toxin-antitoxin system prevent-host-death family antitoxin [Bifidobacteriaceae bacterium]